MNNLESITGPAPADLLIAFTDIAGFAAISDRLPAEKVVNMLSSFYELTGDIVETAGGIVVKFIGDASLIVFPNSKAQQGVEALRQLKSEGEKHFAESGCEARIHIKAHIGSVTCARVGTRTDKRFDVFGDTVNFAARLPNNGFVLSDRLQEEISA